MLFPTATAICRLRVNCLSRSSNSSLLWRNSTFARTFSLHHTRQNSKSLDNSQNTLIYDGPLASTFRKLKIFSLSSLTLSCSMAPLIFVIESQLPIFARTGLALMAVSTSGVSTGVIAWAAHPYVLILRRIDPANNGGTKGLEFVTANWRLQKRITRVYDTSFLTTTDRPFAKWQLAEKLVLPEQAEPSSASPESLPNLTPAPGSQETVAETFDASGDLIGSWIVTWGKHEERGVGTCRAVGAVVKHFQVHPELFELH